MAMPANTFDDEYLARKTVRTETGCLEWLGGKARGGYGKTSLYGRDLVAHRAVWEARNGPIPEGKILCHACDNPACVNVDHLFVGTHKDNSEDMVAKGRSACGSKVGTAKLTADVVLAVRSESGTYAQVARKFGLKAGNVRLIKLRETWRHLA